MKPRLKLSTKIFLLALANFAFIGFILVVFLALQFRQDLGSVVLMPARERMAVISRELTLEIEQSDSSDLDAIVKRHAAEVGTNLYLFLNDGRQVGGPPVTLPVEVMDELQRRPPPSGGRGGRGGPPPGGPPPGLGPGAGPGAAFNASFFWSKSDVPYWIIARVPVRSKDEEGAEPGTLVAGFSSLFANPFFGQMWTWLGLIAVAGVSSIMFWTPLVRGLTRTVDQMMHATSDIADGKFDVEIRSKRQDELGLLAGSISRMAGRLENFVKGQRRFLGDVAHELRTPLGRMQIALEILERRAEESSAGYISDMKEEVALMSDLTDQLLTFAKAELRPDSVMLVPTKISEIVDRVVQVEASGADIHVDVNPELQALAEPEYLFRSVSNLVRNSLRYAAGAGPIEITAQADNQNVLITVADSGPGVPENALEKIFEPFFRIDKSRDRKTGGTGLGLAIVRTCVEACQGSIECRNRKPSGLSVTLRLARA
ncbi:MAG TPA: HAMP domain-containing sensor histidine kinase [Terriglobia bacterium]|nr:HAMP domain-containing sensor histidine kinase [Terriglobia bacterium]